MRILIILTVLSIFCQILLVYANSLTSKILDTFISNSITTEVFHSRFFITGLISFLFSQIIVYTVFVCAIWYLATSCGEILRLRRGQTLGLGVSLWLVSAVSILAANTYYSPFSFFSVLVNTALLQQSQSSEFFKTVFESGVIFLLIFAALTFLNLLQALYKKQHLFRHGLVLIFIAGIVGLVNYQRLAAAPLSKDASSENKPNIIIIGLDALRPDRIGFYQQNKIAHTPAIDAFLSSSIHFSNATTTLARTFPSWASILTGSYPIHSHARGNNTKLDFINVAATLPKQFKSAGYETIYGTDDTRFNNTNETFGFDHTITPPMGVNDFLFGSINDFPLTNLLIPTAVGKLLFPYNYANHGTAITYTPNNFLRLLQDGLHQRDAKPLFIVVHFTLSHWPFYWFNDQQAHGNEPLARYAASVTGVDNQLNQFLNILATNNILDHAIVVLLSDHGTSLGLPGDRPITVPLYQGDPVNISKIPVVRYSNPLDNIRSKSNFHIDSSYGYGGDVLSLIQSHTLLAFKSYGVNIGKPHAVSERVSMLDIAPTLLELVKLPQLAGADGISLKPYLEGKSGAQSTRHFFLETTYSIDEIEKSEIAVNEVLQKALGLYTVDHKTGLIFIKPSDEAIMNHDKQFAVLEGDWLLARYPTTFRTRLAMIPGSMNAEAEKYTLPPYFVLVNLKSGQWTTELDTPFARQSPAQTLLNKLKAFYGNELNSFDNSAKMTS